MEMPRLFVRGAFAEALDESGEHVDRGDRRGEAVAEFSREAERCGTAAAAEVGDAEGCVGIDPSEFECADRVGVAAGPLAVVAEVEVDEQVEVVHALNDSDGVGAVGWGP